MADRRGRRFGMLHGCCSIHDWARPVVVLWPTFPALVLPLFFPPWANTSLTLPYRRFIGDRIPYERRGRTIAITEFGWSLAFILGVPLVGFLIARGGWMAPFPLMTLLGALIFRRSFLDAAQR